MDTYIHHQAIMTNRSRRFPYSADQVCAILERASLAKDDGEPRFSNISMLGPLPLYEGVQTANAGTFSAEQVGWRGLIRGDDKPIAIIDFPFQPGSRTRPSAIVRGEEAAAALDKALQLSAIEAASVDRTYSELRFLRFSSALITTLWLYGRRPLFIPTRLGCGSRPHNVVVQGRRELTALLQPPSSMISAVMSQTISVR